MLQHLLQRTTRIEPREIRVVLWSVLYFFCLLCSYYILRPVRDEMGLQAGIENLQWLFTGTFIAMLLVVPLFGAVVARFARRRLLPLVYGFFILNLVLFFIGFQSGIGTALMARAFFIWVSVFNLLVVSVFWSFMADLFSSEQAGRLFGVIAVGGSAGAIAGPAITVALADWLGPINLLPVSAVFLTLALVCIGKLLGWSEQTTPEPSVEEPIGGGIFDGAVRVFRSPYLLGICLFIWLYTTLSTFLYFQQAHIVADAFDDPGKRTALFATIDLLVNILTVLAQVLITARLVERFGLPTTLALIPALLAVGFLALGLLPVLAVVMIVQVIRRAGNYAITRPSREMLFTVVNREDKYKSKNVIDTVVYRGGDAVSSWIFAGLMAMGLGLSAIAWLAVPMAIIWLWTGLAIGKRQRVLQSSIAQGRLQPVVSS